MTQDNRKLPALEQYLEEVFGGRYYVRPSKVTVQTSITEIVKNNFERLGLTLINGGANDIHLMPDTSVTSSVGILLGSNGGFLSLTARDDLILVGYGFWGVASTASSDLTIMEVLRYTE